MGWTKITINQKDLEKRNLENGRGVTFPRVCAPILVTGIHIAHAKHAMVKLCPLQLSFTTGKRTIFWPSELLRI